MKSPSTRLGAYLLVSLATLCVAAGQSERTNADTGGSVGEGAQAPAAASSPSLTEADTLFLQQASRLGQVELEAAKLASTRASKGPVRAYAQIVAREQTAIEASLASLTDLKGLQRGPRADSGAAFGQTTSDGPSDDEGPSFDRRYVSFVSTGQVRAVELYTSAAQSTQDAEVKHFAMRTLPKVQAHLALARQLNDIASSRD